MSATRGVIRLSRCDRRMCSERIAGLPCDACRRIQCRPSPIPLPSNGRGCPKDGGGLVSRSPNCKEISVTAP